MDNAAPRRKQDSPLQNDDRFRLFVEAVRDYAIFMLDSEGRISSWNAGAQRINGYTADEIIGRHFSCFYPEEDVQAGKPEWELKMAAADGRFEDEHWRIRKDGTRFWANVIITALRDERGHLYGYGKVTRDFTERMKVQESLQQTKEDLEMEVLQRREAERRLQISEGSLRRLSQSVLKTQDEERRRIGRELHDSVGQYLSVLKMSLDRLTRLREFDEKTLGECSRLAEDTIREVRTISYLLYPPLLEEGGLKSAIPWYLEGFAKRSGIIVNLDISPEFDRFEHAAELALFRVLQEGLTNVHRHSGSSTADIRVSGDEKTVSVEIEDKGKGIPSEVIQELRWGTFGSVGVGLRSMSERMKQLGGSLEVESAAGRTVIRATVPREAQPEPPQANPSAPS